ncbi:nicotinate-nucleotide--dimethylbenzimidazole phosphoribosyltransferase [Thioalkalicoccus limnaeus]|uniref:Nicotinate-nucleotide--dimethylbenzimidazole phosphoribosyltransferase n=1 Tax=Thioalkalicoccus limnaeus TaxID=120681 RepID=A0ABV4BA82_9GAMM
MSQDLEWLNVPAARLDESARQNALARQVRLTKPPGALGRLEELAVHLAAMQGTEQPRADRVHIVVFAGDHGVAAEGISAFPQVVTAEMVKNFARGGAAISVAARVLGARLEVVNLGTVVDTGALDGVTRCDLGPGTANFVIGPAMDEHQCVRALAAGRHAAERARLAGADVFIGGEMGIGNTTAAAALACALLSAPAEALAGPGTGLSPDGVAHKITVIDRALSLHRDHLGRPFEALRRVGGFEIAALTGGYLSCAQMGLPVLVDGFISTVAALTAERLRPGAVDWFILSHASAEPGHRQLVQALGIPPLLDLGLRLGEGSGAAVAVPLLRIACALHNQMATFAEAEVSERH